MRHGDRQSIDVPLDWSYRGALFYHRRGRIGTGTEKCRRRHTFFSPVFSFSFNSFSFSLVTSQNFCSFLFNPIYNHSMTYLS